MKTKYKLMLGDNMISLKKLPDNSVDSVVTDPPYGLSFMGKKWDYDVPSIDFWKEVYRVLKPGGHILSFGGTRTYHRMVVNIEDAGFEIRDQIMWIYGSGFPKSHNIGKAIDKLEGNERVEIKPTGRYKSQFKDNGVSFVNMRDIDTDNKKDIKLTKGNSKYEGYGTALKPANEPICVARKPLSEKTVAANMIKWGTGGINIDGCRIGNEEKPKFNKQNQSKGDIFNVGSKRTGEYTTEGRFPANIIFECICDEVIKGEKGEVKRGKPGGNTFGGGDMSDAVQGIWYNDTGDIHTNPDCPCYQLDQQSGITNQGHWAKSKTTGFGEYGGGSNVYEGVGPKDKTKGGASRYFYIAKVSKKERNMGLEGFEEKIPIGRDPNQDKTNAKHKPTNTPKANFHPTVKPIKLMQYLIRLVTPENGIVLDPFMGSGSTGVAAMLENKRFVGMEMDPEYFKIAEKRIESWEEYKKIIK